MTSRTALTSIFIFLAFIPIMGQSSVWKVTKKNKTIYLGGTIHILREQDFPFPAEFDQAYNNAEVLVFEANIKSMQDPAMATKMMQAAVYGGDTTLQTMLSETAYHSLENAFKEVGMQIAIFNKMRVSMTVMSLTALKFQQMGMSAVGVDMYYLDKALEEGKKVEYLESVEKQINLLTHMGDGYEDSFVFYSLEDINQADTLLESMIFAWRTGESASSEEIIQEMKSEYPVLYQDLLVNRNNEWMKSLKKFLKSKEVELVLVGDLHLVGPDGLLELLRNNGYQVEQYKTLSELK
ncbi:MAG TPA: TraB/GumN family protein [Bacteroidales bacterium]|nr:TraB/GumN family protein [Bacteroidales bacterium]HRX96711.1 TraB/GumN family protein [Bacteroidales bacterium]